MKIVNKNMFVCLAATFFMVSVPQQSYGQGWLKKLSDGINKGLESVNKAFGGSSTSTNSSNANTNTNANAAAQQNSAPAANVNYGDKNKARYQIHTTAQTKTITIDGGIINLERFCNGRAIVTTPKGRFVIDKQGNKIFDIAPGYNPKYTLEHLNGDDNKIWYDSNRLMVYSENKKSAIIYDENGNIIKEFKDIFAVSGFRNGVAIIRKVGERPGSWGTIPTRVWYYIDVNGKPLSNTMVATNYSEKNYRLFPLKEGLAPSYQNEKNIGKWGYLNAQCQWAIKPQYDDLGADEGGGFYNGLSRACDASSKKWGFINKQGQWVIQPSYTNRPGNFYSKYALVTDKANRKYFIDQTDKFVWEQPAERITIREFMSTGYAIWTYQSGSYIIDTSFNKVSKIDIDAGGGNSRVVAYNDEYFQWHTSWDYTNKVFDWNGYLLLQYNDSKGVFSEGICSTVNYYFNDKGEIIVKFEDTKF